MLKAVKVQKIIKRSGVLVPFDGRKIKIAVGKAFAEVYGSDRDYSLNIDNVYADVMRALEKSEFKSDYPSVEEVQDKVQEALAKVDITVLLHFHAYRLKQAQERKEDIIYEEAFNIIDNYIGEDDWEVKENSNMGYSVQGLNNYISSNISKKYWMGRVYDSNVKRAIDKNLMHVHDLNLIAPYCCGWDLEQLLIDGFQGAKQKNVSGPSRHFSTILGQIANFLYTLQGESAGAQAFSNIDTYLAPFIREDNLSYAEVKREVRSFIFNLNVPTRVGFQSPFTNVTLDLVVPDHMKNQPTIISGVNTEHTYGEYQAEVDMFNKAFCEVMIEGDYDGNQFPYPIPTYNITNEFDWDSDISNLIFEMTAKYGIPYFANFINSDMKPEDVRSMCPLTGDTEVLVKSDMNGIRVTTIKNIVNGMTIKGTKYKIFYNGNWVDAKPVKVPMTKVYEIKLSNGLSVKMGENHLQPTMFDGTLSAKDLKPGMFLPFNKYEIGTDLGSFDLGFAVGAYVGDGSHDKNSLIYSLDAGEKDDETVDKLRAFWTRAGFEVKLTECQRNVRFVRVNGNAYDIIKRYVKGNSALDKELTRHVYNSSVEFKKGLLGGLRSTDGARSKKRLYTSSLKIKNDLMNLFASLGKKALCNYADNRDGRFGINPNYRIDYPERTNYGELYKEDDNYNYFAITEISEVKMNGNSENLYCFEVINDEHLFMLANGLITHNCRLRLNLKELKKKGGGMFGANPKTGSIGVVTMNLPLIAYLTKGDKESFKQLLRETMDTAKESLDTKRVFLEKMTVKGLYPYIKFYMQAIKDGKGGYWANHFSTIGLVGMNECIANFTNGKENITTTYGQEFSLEVMNYMRSVLEEYQVNSKEKVMYNLEATPAEGTSYRLAKIDKEKNSDIITAGVDNPYYTNSTQLPVDYTTDIFEAMGLQEDIQVLYTGGTVFHGMLGESLPNGESAKKLVKSMLKNTQMPYITVSPTFSICKEHGYIKGEAFNCPICGAEAEVYARVVGFYRPVRNWNVGKSEEYKQRAEFIVE